MKVDDVARARPEVLKAVETMMKKGKFSVPGMLMKSRGSSVLTCFCRLQGEVRRPLDGVMCVANGCTWMYRLAMRGHWQYSKK